MFIYFSLNIYDVYLKTFYEVQVVINHSTEFLIAITGGYKDGRLAWIVFITNQQTFGPFGTSDGGCNLFASDQFNYNFGCMYGDKRMSCLGGFLGSVFNGFVYGIGVYVMPLKVPVQNVISVMILVIMIEILMIMVMILLILMMNFEPKANCFINLKA